MDAVANADPEAALARQAEELHVETRRLVEQQLQLFKGEIQADLISTKRLAFARQPLEPRRDFVAAVPGSVCGVSSARTASPSAARTVEMVIKQALESFERQLRADAILMGRSLPPRQRSKSPTGHPVYRQPVLSSAAIVSGTGAIGGLVIDGAQRCTDQAPSNARLASSQDTEALGPHQKLFQEIYGTGSGAIQKGEAAERREREAAEAFLKRLEEERRKAVEGKTSVAALKIQCAWRGKDARRVAGERRASQSKLRQQKEDEQRRRRARQREERDWQRLQNEERASRERRIQELQQVKVQDIRSRYALERLPGPGRPPGERPPASASEHLESEERPSRERRIQKVQHVEVQDVRSRHSHERLPRPDRPPREGSPAFASELNASEAPRALPRGSDLERVRREVQDLRDLQANKAQKVSRLRLLAALGEDPLRCQECDEGAVELHELLQALRRVCIVLQDRRQPATALSAIAEAVAGVAHVDPRLADLADRLAPHAASESPTSERSA